MLKSSLFKKTLWKLSICAAIGLIPAGTVLAQQQEELTLNDSSYFERPGLNVMVFSNWYNGDFSDAKISGIEIIHHGERTATNGDLRLQATPEQWDPIPTFKDRKIDRENKSIEAYLSYPDYDFDFTIKGQAHDGGMLISIHTDKPLPEELAGRAGFNMEFLPAAYFDKTYLIDGKSGAFPRYPSGPMTVNKFGDTEPLPIAKGKKLVLAPEDPERRINISANDGGELALYDGRNKAQNGWFVVRTLIPEGKTGKVIEWSLKANTIPGWVREPMIAFSQVGYHPDQQKVAVIELDKKDQIEQTARLLKVSEDGTYENAKEGAVDSWGRYLRYNYGRFDFSDVKESGLYEIEYGDTRTTPFRIETNIYEDTWYPTLDVFFPVQMDHMFVNEAYRVWHGASHLDDALQAPVNHEHHDLYRQGPETQTKFQPGEHIPGLDIGGWYDAGDFDIRTQTVYHVLTEMVNTWETFDLKRDETLIDQENKYVDIHRPDGKPDLLQQIEHGTLFLISHFRSVGHALNGVVEAHLSQYTHLGDAVTKTDNLIYTPEFDSLETDGFRSGTFDDRWAFTNKSTPLNYGSIAALAAASRALRGYNDELARECLETAKKVWAEEHSHEPDIFYHGNTTGGPLDDEELKAAVELLLATEDKQYAKRVNELWPTIDKKFNRNASLAVRALPHMNKSFAKKLEARTKTYKEELDAFGENPFGVHISRAGWAGNGQIVGQANNNYYLHKQFPELIDAEYVFKGLNYIYGTHPDHNLSFVSGVGNNSQTNAYGNNRADFSFIAGGVVPGVLILNPDYPENKTDWPFLWGENEYVVNVGASYIFLVNAANDLLNPKIMGKATK
jgi:endoglucanase